MKRAMLLAFALAATVTAASAVETEQNPTVKKLQEISVTIRAESGGGFFGSRVAQGSGVLFTRQEGDDTVTYVWTAAHVVDSLRSARQVVINGSPKTVVEFKDAQIVQEFRQNGRRIGESKMDAKVIRYSDAQTGEDLALLEVRKRNFVPANVTAKFYLSDEIPTIGTELYHVGSLLGQFGSNSLTTGVVSQIGRVLELSPEGTVFDQTTVTAFPGSSGGGVFLKSNGDYVGMLIRGAGEQFNLIVPVRRLRAWAKTAKVEWAIDPTFAMPSAEELAKLPVEDAGVTFAPGCDKAKESRRALEREYPFLLRYPDVSYESQWMAGPGLDDGPHPAN